MLAVTVAAKQILAAHRQTAEMACSTAVSSERLGHTITADMVADVQLLLQAADVQLLRAADASSDVV